jgi:hypothetical protein
MTLSMMRYNPCQPVIDAVYGNPGQALRLADELATQVLDWDHDYSHSICAALVLGAAVKDPLYCTLTRLFELNAEWGGFSSFVEDLVRLGGQAQPEASVDRLVGLLARNMIDIQTLSPSMMLSARMRLAYALRPYAEGTDLAAMTGFTTVRFRSLEEWAGFRHEISRVSSHASAPLIWAARKDLASHGVATCMDMMLGRASAS